MNGRIWTAWLWMIQCHLDMHTTNFITEKSYMVYHCMRPIHGIDTDGGRTAIMSDNVCSMVEYRITVRKVQTGRSLKTKVYSSANGKI